MQHLRGGGWVKASAAPAGELLIKNLLAKGWIERRGLGRELSYRLTDEGLAAKQRVSWRGRENPIDLITHFDTQLRYSGTVYSHKKSSQPEYLYCADYCVSRRSRN